MDKRYNKSSKQFDVKGLSDHEVVSLSNVLGDKVSDIIADACKKADKILNKYGLRAKMQFVIEPSVQESKEL